MKPRHVLAGAAPAADLLTAVLAVALAGLPPVPAGAVMVVGELREGGPPPSLQPAPRAAASAAPDLIGGTLAAVDPRGRTMTVAGRTLAWHPTGLRVFGLDGVPVGESYLQPGMRVRFAVEPGAAAGRRVILVYVDARP